MKLSKVILTMLFIILLSTVHSYAFEYKSEVKVGLKYGESSKSFTVSSEGGVNVFVASTGELMYQSLPNESIYIELTPQSFLSSGKFEISTTDTISIQPQNGALIECDAKKYRGYIIAKRESGTLTVINAVGTEDYVASVLGKEMSYSWPKEALKAQAVCARNFVLCRGNTHKNYDFDVCATTHCQVYGGFSSEHENTRAATKETEGVLVRYNGEVVPLFFYATSGGMTESVENVWGNPLGYLKSVPDEYENPQKASKYTWSATLTKDEIETKLKSAGASIGSLNNITVDTTTPSGRVTKMTFHGDSGTFSTKLEKCRTILGLYSQKFTVSGDKSAAIITTAGASVGPYIAQNAEGKKAISSLRAIDGSGIVREVKIDGEGSTVYNINGGGYGHGVGMSQWGARGMAENGFTYDEILNHYFTDITIGE